MSEKAVSVRAVFTAALAITDPAQRGQYLAAATQGQPDLRARVEALLRAHSEAGRFLEGTALGQSEPGLQEGPGTVIGRYKLLELIGEGGFGVVYRAAQTEPVQREVALKIVKPGMDTRQVIARFEAERQALALMDHSNIAKVLDAGTTDSGRPYFVMELVEGVPITDYCDRHQLDTRQRLELFLSVCDAVQHAHQKGIIHRDLKPSNILVMERDFFEITARANVSPSPRAGTLSPTGGEGRGEGAREDTSRFMGRTGVRGQGASPKVLPIPKVIDFGVAKAIGRKLTEKTLVTLEHQFLGTPVYCSPEQVDPAAEDVDTRSDIYSLGVVLYELLTGHTPFDPEELKRATWNEVVRIVREQDPPKPSTRLTEETSKAESGKRKAERDGASLRRLLRLKETAAELRGDLDWIVMKALEKDRSRRYASTSTLALDIQRFLNHEPVEAAAPTVMYRTSKFIRRHRLGVAAAAAVVLALLGGIGLSLWQAHQAEQARQAALASRGQAERLIVFLLRDLSKNLAPLGREDLYEAILGQATNYFRNLPVEKLTPEEVYNRSLAYENLGNLNLNQGRWNMDIAEPYYRQALALRQKALAADPNNREWQRGLAQLYIEFSEIFTQRSDDEEYLRYIGLAQNILTNLLARQPNDFECRWLLGQTYFLLGQNAGNSNRQTPQADPLLATLRHSVRYMEALHQERPEDQEVHFHLGYQYFVLAAAMALSTNLEHHLESLQHYQRTHEIFNRLIQQAPQHYQAKYYLAFSLVWKGWLLMRMARPGDAEEAFRSLNEGFRILDEIRPYRGAGPGYQLVETRYYHTLGMLRRETDPPQAYTDFWRSMQVCLKSSHSTKRQSMAELHKTIARGTARYEFFHYYREFWIRMMQAAKAKGDATAIQKYWSDMASLLRDYVEILQETTVLEEISVASTRVMQDGLCEWLLASGLAAPLPDGYAEWLAHPTNQVEARGTILVATNAVWKFYDLTNAPGADWRQPGFNDDAWAAGPTPLGFGEWWINSRIATNYDCAYFRHEFVVPDPGQVQSLWLRLLRDDGAVVYLNGREILRENLRAGTLYHHSRAEDAIGTNSGEGLFFEFQLSPKFLAQGRNQLAVEVHQYGAKSSDLSFGLELVANPPRLAEWRRQHEVKAERMLSTRPPEFHQAMLLVTETSMPKPARQASGRWISDSYRVLASLKTAATNSPIQLIPDNAVWKYMDDGRDLGTRWRERDYDDRAWRSVTGTFNESYHSSKHPKPITYYFRRELVITNHAGLDTLLARVKRNDAIVMYLNGQEILRDNLPAGPIHYRSIAQRRNDLESNDFLIRHHIPLQATNVLAVELHVARNFLDRPGIFEMELLGNLPPLEDLLREIKPEEVLKFFVEQGLPFPAETLRPPVNSPK